MRLDTISFLLFLVNSFFGISDSQADENGVIKIDNNTLLDAYFCGKNGYKMTSNTYFQLNTSFAHVLRTGSLCVVSGVRNITISGSLSRHVKIVCDDTSVVPRGGIGFYNSSNIVLRNIHIVDCGGNMSSSVNQTVLETSPLYFYKDSCAVLLFNECSNISLRLIIIKEYYGYALVALRLMGNSVFKSIFITINYLANHSESVDNVGSGMLIYHYGNMSKGTSQLLINGLNLYFNMNLIKSAQIGRCIQNYFLPNGNNLERMPIMGAGGLTLLYTQNGYDTSVIITNAYIKENVGTVAGGVLILKVNSVAKSETIINETIIDSNLILLANCHGAGVMVHVVFTNMSLASRLPSQWDILMVQRSSFKNHNGNFFRLASVKSVGAVYLSAVSLFENYTNLYFRFHQVNFSNNIAIDTGACIYAETLFPLTKALHSMHIYLTDVNAISNGRKEKPSMFSNVAAGIFSFVNIRAVHISGTVPNGSLFINNIGSVFDAFSSPLHLSGYLQFLNGFALYGAAFKLRGYSKLIIETGLQARFSNNTALITGGAIWSDKEEVFDGVCILQFPKENNKSENGSYANIKMTFQNNSANNGGNSILVSPLYNCQQQNLSMGQEFKLYASVFSFEDNPQNYHNNISSMPEKLIVCDNENIPKNQTSTHFPASESIYPGQSLSIYLAALDGNNKSVGAQILLSQPGITLYPSTKQFQLQEDIQFCTEVIIQVKVHYSSDHCPNTKPGYCIRNFLFSFPGNPPVAVQKVLIYPCPSGFQFNSASGICECCDLLKIANKELKQNIMCNIKTQTIVSHQSYIWIGYTSKPSDSSVEPLLGLAVTCPLASNSCSIKNMTQHNIASDCIDSREGVLCGSCIENKSVVFGSDECFECSNYWLLSLIGYMIAGFLLILVLFILRLTLTAGTINGFILYANIANAGMIGIHTRTKSLQIPSSLNHIFLSFLNLDLGFPICFYNGMTEIKKSYFLFLFPLYLLSLIVAIIFISKKSTTMSYIVSSTGIPVLVTIIHLSFSRFATTIIDAFSVATLYTLEDGKLHHINVWLLEGGILYSDPHHIGLMVASVLSIVIFLLPYTFLLIGARLWIRFAFISKYLKPFFDAILAPYKEDQQHWFGLRLVLVMLQYTIYSLYRGSDFMMLYTINGSVFMGFSILHALSRPYRSMALNVLDTSLMLNLCILYSSLIYSVGKYETAQVLYTINALLLIVFAMFILIVVYHVILLTSKYDKLIQLWMKARFQIRKIEQSCFGVNTNVPISVNDTEDSYYDDSNLRESLLDYA